MCVSAAVQVDTIQLQCLVTKYHIGISPAENLALCLNMVCFL